MFGFNIIGIKILMYLLAKEQDGQGLTKYKICSRAAARVLSTLICLALLASFPCVGSHAYANLPGNIRIGLNYGGGSGAGKASSSYDVYGKDGVSVGYSDGGEGYMHFCELKFPDANSRLSLIKHSFSKSHAVVTGRDTYSFQEISGRVKALQQKGYDPYLAFLGRWVLIVDFYASQELAQAAINTYFAAQFPGYGFNAEPLSGKYILAAIGKMRMFIFDAGGGNLIIHPLGSGDGGGLALIELNGKKYRGAIEINRRKAGEMIAVNYVSMDDYLYGVVPREIGASSPAEALKAQAVAARSYAAKNIGKHGADGFDLCTTTHCQVYGGYESENTRSSDAVDATSGEIVTYKGSPAEVYYFDSSGGHTENSMNVWGGREYPYLKGVEDKYESGNSHNYVWEAVYTAEELKSKLAGSGVHIGDITGVSVTKTSAAGSAIEVTITGTEGVKVYTNGSCRTFLGNLQSQMYTVYTQNAIGADNAVGSGSEGANGGGSEGANGGGSEGANASGSKGANAGGSGGGYYAIGAEGDARQVSGPKEAVASDGRTVSLPGVGGAAVSDSGTAGFQAKGQTFRFAGRGWGHGVGMSQEGAKGMAGSGFSYEQILTHYFPGCAVE